MPVADQWKLREKASVPSSPPAAGTPTASVAGSTSPTAEGRSLLVAGGKPSLSDTTTSATDKAAAKTAEAESGASSATVSHADRSTKNLAGFWSSQNDEVKVRKKRLVQVDAHPTSDIDATDTTGGGANGSASGSSQTTAGHAADVENSTDSNKTTSFEAGRTKNISSAFQQQQQQHQQPERKQPSQPSKSANVTDRWSVMSNESSASGRHSSTSSSTIPDVVLNRKSDAIVLAENQPIELGADVVRSEGSSWDDVAELEAGRTKNLLARWKATEQEYSVPKTSTTRYSGSKPAWILEIEAAKETSSGAIGTSWTGAPAEKLDEEAATLPSDNAWTSGPNPDADAGSEISGISQSQAPTAASRDNTIPERVGDEMAEMTSTIWSPTDTAFEAISSSTSEQQQQQQQNTSMTSVERQYFDDEKSVAIATDPQSDSAAIPAVDEASRLDDVDDVFQPAVEPTDWTLSFSATDDRTPDTVGAGASETVPCIVDEHGGHRPTSSRDTDDDDRARHSGSRTSTADTATSADDDNDESFHPATETLPPSTLETVSGYDVLTVGFWSSTEPSGCQIASDIGDDDLETRFATATGREPFDEVGAPAADVDEKSKDDDDDDNDDVCDRQRQIDDGGDTVCGETEHRPSGTASGGTEDAQEQQQQTLQLATSRTGKKRKDKDDKRKSTNSESASHRERRWCLVM